VHLTAPVDNEMFAGIELDFQVAQAARPWGFLSMQVFA
jgi:hypothetical protein